MVDHAQARLDRLAPAFGNVELGQQLAAAHAEEVRDRARLAEVDQARVDAVLQRATVLDQVQPEARQLACRARLGIRQPDRWNEVELRQARQYLRVDLVGLAGERRESLDLVGVGDLDLPAVVCQDVANEAGSGHRLDDGGDRLFVNSDLRDQVSKTVGVGWRGRARDELSVVAQDADVEAPAAEIQSSVQHGMRASFGGSGFDAGSVSPGRPSFIAFRKQKWGGYRGSGIPRQLQFMDDLSGPA